MPWNYCNPYADQDLSIRCPNGCLAVATAQIAKYLHSYIGKPVSTYACGSCYDIYNDYYDIDLGCYSSNVWQLMPNDSTDFSVEGMMAVSALMADVCLKSNSVFNPLFTYASLNGARSYLSSYNVHSSVSSFDNDIVINSILDGLPVLLGLDESPVGQAGTHTAVIDGMKIYSYRYVDYYEWMPRWTYPPVEPEEPDWDNLDQYVLAYRWGTNSICHYRINWGWDGLLDNGLFLYGNNWDYNQFTPGTIVYYFH